MTKIFLDTNSPATNFLLGVTLAGGDILEFIVKMSKHNKGKKHKRSTRKQINTKIEKTAEAMKAYRITGKKPR